MKASAVNICAPAPQSVIRIQRSRKPGLDLIRAIAIVWVMLYHASIMGLMSAPAQVLISFGWMGVDLFFVLSGYLIASQLLRPVAAGQRSNYRTFFSRRLLRTLPAYAVLLAIYFLAPGLRERAVIQPFWQYLTFTENLFIDVGRGTAFSHVWSLCVEEQFYLMFPIAVMALTIRPSTAKTVTAIASILALGIGLRGYLWLAHVSSQPFDAAGTPDHLRYMKLIYYPTWSRLDGLLAGISIAAIEIFRPSLWQRMTCRPNLLLALGMMGTGAAMLWFGGQISTFYPTIFAYPLLALSIALLVAGAADSHSLAGRYTIPGAKALATGAYSLYLSHKIAFHLAAPSDDGSPDWLHLSLAFGLALTFGTALYWCVERPFLRLRDRLDGRTRTPTVSDVSPKPGLAEAA
ncbi:acyltransferase family protein [Novosphingobium terrae]|uniref:acyltransferase family protein n=1 Tax=Novosphingobium terrae TaxID=2726189 RepID=UPI00197F1377|nr:acyltransferase [Novosphingobium terrae]